MNRTQLLARCSAAAAAAAIIAGLAAIPATARPDPGEPIRDRFSSYHSCPLNRIGTQLVRCDNQTGGGVIARWFRSCDGCTETVGSLDPYQSHRAERVRRWVDHGTVTILKRHRAELASIDLRLAKDDAVVFGTATGELRHPERFSRRFTDAVAAARRDLGEDLPAIRLHDLRHSHASLLLAAGVPVKEVSERLGHASPVITLGVYSASGRATASCVIPASSACATTSDHGT